MLSIVSDGILSGDSLSDGILSSDSLSDGILSGDSLSGIEGRRDGLAGRLVTMEGGDTTGSVLRGTTGLGEIEILVPTGVSASTPTDLLDGVYPGREAN